MAESLRYKDKVTIVTGGSKGIGRGCVEVFGEWFLSQLFIDLSIDTVTPHREDDCASLRKKGR